MELAWNSGVPTSPGQYWLKLEPVGKAKNLKGFSPVTGCAYLCKCHKSFTAQDDRTNQRLRGDLYAISHHIQLPSAEE